jgi:hypothetical protein
VRATVLCVARLNTQPPKAEWKKVGSDGYQVLELEVMKAVSRTIMLPSRQRLIGSSTLSTSLIYSGNCIPLLHDGHAFVFPSDNVPYRLIATHSLFELPSKAVSSQFRQNRTGSSRASELIDELTRIANVTVRQRLRVRNQAHSHVGPCSLKRFTAIEFDRSGGDGVGRQAHRSQLVYQETLSDSSWMTGVLLGSLVTSDCCGESPGIYHSR